MSSTAEIKAVVTGEDRGASSVLQKFSNNIEKAAKDAADSADKASGAFGSLGNVGKSVFSSVASGLVHVAQRVAEVAWEAFKTGTLAAGAALVGLGVKGIASANQLQSLQLSMNGLTHSMEMGAQAMAGAYEYAQKSPFQLPEVAGATKTLIAYGMTANAAVASLQTLGNVSIVTGVPIQHLAGIFGQVSAQGKLMLGDIRQLTENGVAILPALQTQLGKTAQEVQDMATNGQISFEMFNKAMQSMVDPSILEQLNNTLPRQIDRLKGSIRQLSNAFVGVSVDAQNGFKMASDGLAQVATDVTKELANLLRAPDLLAQFRTLGNQLATIIKGVAPLIKTLVGTLTTIAQPLITLLGTVMTIVKTVLEAALPGLTVFFNALNTALLILQPALTQTAGILGEALGNVLIALAPSLVSIAQSLAIILPPLATLVALAAEFTAKFVGLLTQAVRYFASILGITSDLGMQLASRIEEGFRKRLTQVKGIAEILITKIKEGDYSGAGEQLATGIIHGIQAIGRRIHDIYNAVAPAIAKVNWFDMGLNAAQNIVSGLIVGIAAGITKLDLGKLLDGGGKGDYAAVGRNLASGILHGLDSLASSADQIFKTVANVLGQVDWIGVGLTVGGKIIPGLVIGLIAGVANVDLGKLFDGIKDHIGPILIGVLTIAFAPTKLLGPITKLLGKIPLAGRLIVWAVEGLNEFGHKVLGLVGGLMAKFGQGFISGLELAGPKVVPAIVNFVKLIPTRIALLAMDFYNAALRLMEGLGRGLAEHGPKQVVAFFRDIKDKIFGFLADAGIWLWDIGSKIMGGLIDGIKSMGGSLWAGIVEVASAIGRFFAPAVTWLVESGRQVIGGLVGGVRAMAGELWNGIAEVASAIGRFFAGAAGWLWDTGGAIIRGLANGIRSAGGDLWAGISEVASKIGSFFSGAYNWLFDVGKWIVWGLKDGMLSVINSIRDVGGNIASAVKDKVKSILGIHSPSKVFAGYGENIVQGMANGINDNLNKIKDAAGSMTMSVQEPAVSLSGNAQRAAISTAPPTPYVDTRINPSQINITIQAGAYMGSQQDARRYAQMIMQAYNDLMSAKGLAA